MGIQPPAPDWGLMINENRIGVATNPWPVAMPVILISALTIGINLVMDSWLHSASRGSEAAEQPTPPLGSPEDKIAVASPVEPEWSK